MSKFKVGDVCNYLGASGWDGLTITQINDSYYPIKGYHKNFGLGSFLESELVLQKSGGELKVGDKVNKQTGGPSGYYDQPYDTWTTTNDQMEWLAKEKWGIYAIHLKDIFKGLCRWGDKNGTTVEYDTRKVIYYGVRVLKMIVGVDEMRKYLQDLLDDKQFKGSDDA